MHGAVETRVDFRTHSVVEGSGPWVVMIHGVGLDLEMWAQQAAALRGSHRLLRFDLLGHGQTPPYGQALSLSDFVNQLEALFDDHAIQRADVVGFSLGAMIAQAFALAHPAKLKKLVLLNGVYARTRAQRQAVLDRLAAVERDGVGATVGAAVERWFTDSFRGSNPQEVAEIQKRLMANALEGFLPAYRMFANADDELAGRLGGVQAPTLVITGEEDVGSTPAMATRMQAEIPDAKLRVLPGVRHMLPMEAAEELNAMLADFLSVSGDPP
jgi:pimeloyl-ACP methyl ester carboxylesterase